MKLKRFKETVDLKGSLPLDFSLLPQGPWMSLENLPFIQSPFPSAIGTVHLAPITSSRQGTKDKAGHKTMEGPDVPCEIVIFR